MSARTHPQPARSSYASALAAMAGTDVATVEERLEEATSMLPPESSGMRSQKRAETEREFQTAWLEEHRLESYRRQLRNSKLPPMWGNVSLRSFRDTTPSVAAARARVAAYGKNAEWNTGRGLYLCGPAGTGKSHLAAVILRGYIYATHKRALWVPVGAWLDNMQERQFDRDWNDSLPSTLLEVQRAQLVVLDDLGAENLTGRREQHLLSVIDHLIGHGRPMIVTSNTPLRRPPGNGSTVVYLSDRLDERLISRIAGATEPIIMRGNDERRSTDT